MKRATTRPLLELCELGPDALFTRREASAYLRCALRKFDTSVRPGLHGAMVGTVALFRREELDQWLSRHPDPESRTNTPWLRTYRKKLAPRTREERELLAKIRQPLRGSGAIEKAS